MGEKKKLLIPTGTKVRVLDTKNVRKFNPDGIGYEFVTKDPLFKGSVTCCPQNKYHTNYEVGDLLVLEQGVINQYEIY